MCFDGQERTTALLLFFALSSATIFLLTNQRLRKGIGMKKKSIVILALVVLLIIAGSIKVICSKSSELPIEADKIYHIDFNIYPEDIPTYTITDKQRIKEIIDIINALDITSQSGGPEKPSAHFYSLFLDTTEGNIIWIELDDKNISVGDENYSADTSALIALLEQTYYDRSTGSIE